MNIKETAQAIEYLRTVCLSESQICEFFLYIASSTETGEDEQD